MNVCGSQIRNTLACCSTRATYLVFWDSFSLEHRALRLVGLPDEAKLALSVNPGDPLVSESLELKYRSRIPYPAFTMGSGIKLVQQALYQLRPLLSPAINFRKVKRQLMIDFKASLEKKRRKFPKYIYMGGILKLISGKTG